MLVSHLTQGDLFRVERGENKVFAYHCEIRSDDLLTPIKAKLVATEIDNYWYYSAHDIYAEFPPDCRVIKQSILFVDKA
jgi:hypothetical protein